MLFMKSVHAAIRVFFILAIVLGSFFLENISPASAASGATLYVTPANGTFVVGSTFTVSLYIDTGGQAVNAVQADLQFPPDKLQVVSPTTGRSFIQIWIGQPNYSNAEGKLHFQGTVPHPGIVTNAGLISTVTFRVMKTGTADIQVLDTSHILLDNGLGTDVLSQRTGGIYSLALPPPEGPLVTSPTNPDQEQWYATRAVIFHWTGTPGIAAYSYVLNQNPVDDPGNIPEGIKTEVAYQGLADGAYYFHIKALQNGTWGGITHYKVQIDNTPPAAFMPTIAPDAYTSNQTPVIYFTTTDVTSGLDHYEVKIIPLNQPAAQLQNTPFFIEASSPYSRHLDFGSYDVVVRAYDVSGNYYQATERLVIAPPAFQFIRGGGLQFGEAFTLSWPYVWSLSALLLLLFGYFARSVWVWHRSVEEMMRHGAHTHPSILERLHLLKEKQEEYTKDNPNDHIPPNTLSVLLLIFLTASAVSVLFFGGVQPAFAETVLGFLVNPPLTTVYPSIISNDEIPYLGGTAQAASGTVVIFVENADTGATLSYAATTDKNGAWFFTFPQFFEPGPYVAWTQFKFGDEMSPPSAQISFTVVSTAFEIGKTRMSAQTFYLLLLLILSAILLGLAAFLVYHFARARAKHRKFVEELPLVEESIRRGFLLLRRDIEAELALFRKTAANQEISEQEKIREKKLLKDLDLVNRHIGKEIWEIENVEKE